MLKKKTQYVQYEKTHNCVVFSILPKTQLAVVFSAVCSLPLVRSGVNGRPAHGTNPPQVSEELALENSVTGSRDALERSPDDELGKYSCPQDVSHFVLVLIAFEMVTNENGLLVLEAELWEDGKRKKMLFSGRRFCETQRPRCEARGHSERQEHFTPSPGILVPFRLNTTT